MTLIPSTVYGDGSQDLATIFPTYLPEPEKLVYEYVNDATRSRVSFPEDPSLALTLPTSFREPPALSLHEGAETTWGYYRDPMTGAASPTADDVHTEFVEDEWPVIPVRRGLSIPARAQLPMIAVGLGDESDDQSDAMEGGGFVEDVVAYDQNGGVFGAASYYAEPLYASVLVELICENRDERDRLHQQLRALLRPLVRKLPDRDQLIHKVALSADKQELPTDEAPNLVYITLFTVEVWFDMLQAVDVVGPNGVIAAIPVTVTPGTTDTIPIPPEDPGTP